MLRSLQAGAGVLRRGVLGWKMLLQAGQRHPAAETGLNQLQADCERAADLTLFFPGDGVLVINRPFGDY